MASSSKPTYSSTQRSTQMINSSNRRILARSRSNLNNTLGSTKAATNTQAQGGSLRRKDSPVDSTETGTADLSELAAGKLSVSRRRISACITPQASPRNRHKVISEKENVKVEDTPLRTTLGRSATSTFRRKPISSFSPSSIRVKSSLLVTRSQSLQASQISNTLKASSDKRVITAKRQDGIANTRSAFSLVKGNNSRSLLEPAAQLSSKSSSSRDSPQPSQATDTNENSIQFGSSPRPNSPTCLTGMFNVPPTPSAPWSPSALRTLFSASPSKSIEPLHLLDLSSPSSSRCVDTTLKHEASAEDQSGSSNPTSFGNLFDVDQGARLTITADSDMAQETENSFELADVVVRSHLPQLGDTSDQNSTPIIPCKGEANVETLEGEDVFGFEARECSVELSEESGFEAVLSSPAIYVETDNFNSINNSTTSKAEKDGGVEQASQNAAKVEGSEDVMPVIADLSRIMELEQVIETGTASSTSNSINSPDSFTTSILPSVTTPIKSIETDTKGSDSEISIELYFTPIKAHLFDAPSTPEHNIQPATPSSPSSIFPASLFPRLFAELTTTYSHLGFSTNSVGMNVPRIDPQATRTQTELVGLRAGAGSVLARARAFGQTLWSPSRIQYNSTSNTDSNVNILEDGATLEISKSGCVGTPPASPTVSATVRDALERADSLHSMAMGQRFRMAKSFELE